MKSIELEKETLSPDSEETQTASRVKKRKIAPQAPRYIRFTTHEAEKRYNTYKGSIIGGKLVDFDGSIEILNHFKELRIESLAILDKSDVYYGLVGEFFVNMKNKGDPSGNVIVKAQVIARAIMLNEVILCKILNQPPKYLRFPKFNSSFFNFNKADFHTFLELICGSPVSKEKFEYDVLISSDFFTPQAQIVSQFLRMNILPRKGTETLFYFPEIKLIYSILTKNLKVNLPHLLLSHMITTNSQNTFAFSLLLTIVFKYLYLPLQEHLYASIFTNINLRTPRQTLPLSDFLIIDSQSLHEPRNEVVIDKSALKLLDKLNCDLKRRNKDMTSVVKQLENKMVDFVMEKQKLEERRRKEKEKMEADWKEQNSFLITTIGELQGKVFVMEGILINPSKDGPVSNLVVHQGFGLDKIENLVNQFEDLTSEMGTVPYNGDTDLTLQPIGDITSSQMDNMAFDPSTFA